MSLVLFNHVQKQVSLQCIQVMLPVQMLVFMYTGVYTSQSPKYHSLVQSCSNTWMIDIIVVVAAVMCVFGVDVGLRHSTCITWHIVLSYTMQVIWKNLYLNKTRDHGTLCHLFSVLGRLPRARKTSMPVLMLSQQFSVDMW